MPGFDRTGPFGQGSMTGRGQGRCGGGQAAGRGAGAGFGGGFGGGLGGFFRRCRGRFGGYGNRFGAGYGYARSRTELPEGDEALKRRLDDIEAEAADIRDRLGK